MQYIKPFSPRNSKDITKLAVCNNGDWHYMGLLAENLLLLQANNKGQIHPALLRIHLREIIQTWSKGEQLWLHVKHHLALTNIINISQKGKRVMKRTRFPFQSSFKGGHNKQPCMHMTQCLDLICMPIKHHQNTQKGIRVIFPLKFI